tara:strand:- start:647 stop:844 length:198 start_codon:yes stop_codon:yes gene_type:complete
MLDHGERMEKTRSEFHMRISSGTGAEGEKWVYKHLPHPGIVEQEQHTPMSYDISDVVVFSSECGI